VPNKAAMEGLSPDLLAQFTNMAIAPADLLKYEQLRDVGDAQRAYSRVVTEVMASR